MSVISSPKGEQRWYVDVDSRVYGPFDSAALAGMIERGQITPTDFVALQGTSDWIEITREPVLRGLFKTLRRANTAAAEPPVRRKRRRWGGTLSAISVFAVVAWIAWPYYAVLSLMQAVRDGDASTLEKHVDWNLFRQNLRGDLNAQLLKDVRSKGSTDAMASGFVAVLGPTVINQMIDGYVTPQAIAALAKSEIDKSPSGEKTPEGIDKSASLVRRVQWDQVKYAFFDGPFSFRVDILPRNDGAMNAPIQVEFVWSGDWRLTRVVLPDDVFKSDTKSTRRSAASNSSPMLPKAAPGPIEPSPITISMQAKRFKPADIRNNDYEAAIVFELSIVNKTTQSIRAFDGMLTFTDLLDNEVLSTKLAINDAIGANSTYNWTGRLKYNQFMDDHNRFKNEDLANLKTQFVVRKILFADGTSKNYP
ncbi:DUF2939 domain-containing protein [Bradyrhizobium sp. LB11.1]|uniref:DUF2939 domain-containing protein n=1 Tax=Bradyrhizobium sp. LB11.1 TaxID=3156326 RepID=UPI003393CC9F